jgi:hypothetical protein
VIIGTGDDRWLNGAWVYPYPTDEPVNWDPCSLGTFRTKAEGAGVTSPTFATFVSYVPITCSSMSIGDPDEFRGRAEIALNAVESFAVERALSQGVDQSLNPFFSDGNVTILAGGVAVSAQTGLGYLENAIGETGRQGLIHLTPAVTAALGFNFVRNEPEDSLEIATPSGTTVVSGGGYIGAHMVGHNAPTGTQSWAFATGPVQVRRSPFELLEIGQVLDRAENIVTFRAERYELATWDTALQSAVLIDWSL